MTTIIQATSSLPFAELFNTTVLGIAFLVFISILIIWSLIWKGIALYRAGRNHSLAWFIVLFIVNTLGILDILYIFIFSKKKTRTLNKSYKSETN